MIKQIPDISPRQLAIISGAAIVLMTIAAVFATDVTIGRLLVPNDSTATINNIVASEIVFRAGIFSWFVVLICDVTIAWGLYLFFKPVNEGLSLLSAWFRVVYAAMLGAAILNYVEVTTFINDANLEALATDQLWHLLHAFDDTWAIGLMVFGFHILLLGYLVYISGYTPKWLGILLIISFGGYLLINATHLLFPGYERLKSILDWIFILPMIAGEVGLGLWLLIKGRNIVWENLNPSDLNESYNY